MEFRTKIYDRLNYQPKLMGVPFNLFIVNVLFLFLITPLLCSTSLKYFGIMVSIVLSIGLFYLLKIAVKLDLHEIYGWLNKIVDRRISADFYPDQTYEFIE